MKIQTSGHPKNITKKEIRDILKWAACEFRVNRFKTPLFIKLKFIQNLKKKHGYRGSAIWDDDNHRPREFTIEVDAGLTRRMTTITLLHEFCHVEQYARGRLKDLMRHYSLKKWEKKIINENKTKYMKLPWEREAYKLELELYEKWKKFTKPRRCLSTHF